MKGRADMTSKIKKRKLVKIIIIVSVLIIIFALIPSLLFRKYNGRPLTGQYKPLTCAAILTDTSRVEQFEQDGSYREVPVHIFYPDGFENIKDHTLPLVIFSHGAFGWYQSNMSAYQELASNGYVVVSIEHPYHSLFTHDTSGKLITADSRFLHDVMNISNSSNEETEREEVFNIEREWIDLRTEDMEFALDMFKSAADEQDFSVWTFTEGDKAQFETAARLIDTGKIGLMGHSLGGATAVTVGRRDDVSAVIDIDGTMLGEQTGFNDGRYVINEEPYRKPLLVIDNEESHRECIELRKTGYDYANNVVLDNAENAYNTYFTGAGHMNYTDLPLISPFFAKMLGTGDINPEMCIDKLNRLILDFFNCHLKGQGEFSVQEYY